MHLDPLAVQAAPQTPRSLPSTHGMHRCMWHRSRHCPTAFPDNAQQSSPATFPYTLAKEGGGMGLRASLSEDQQWLELAARKDKFGNKSPPPPGDACLKSK